MKRAAGKKDNAIFREIDLWMVVCRDKYTGEMVGFNMTLYGSRREALAQRRPIIGLRESVVRVGIHRRKP